LPPVAELQPEPRLRRVHYDWLEAGEHTQRTVARLSQQLRRFLDDQAWLENRRIMDILHNIETRALAVREDAPTGNFIELAEAAASVELPMERPLYRPPTKPQIVDLELEEGETDADLTALFNQVVVDRAELSRNIRQALQEQTQISLAELITIHPLRLGLSELMAYLQLASGRTDTAVDEETVETIEWRLEDGSYRRVRLPRIIFARK
jgi:transcription termination factor NusB